MRRGDWPLPSSPPPRPYSPRPPRLLQEATGVLPRGLCAHCALCPASPAILRRSEPTQLPASRPRPPHLLSGSGSCLWPQHRLKLSGPFTCVLSTCRGAGSARKPLCPVHCETTYDPGALHWLWTPPCPPPPSRPSLPCTPPPPCPAQKHCSRVTISAPLRGLADPRRSALAAPSPRSRLPGGTHVIPVRLSLRGAPRCQEAVGVSSPNGSRARSVLGGRPAPPPRGPPPAAPWGRRPPGYVWRSRPQVSPHSAQNQGHLLAGALNPDRLPPRQLSLPPRGAEAAASCRPGAPGSGAQPLPEAHSRSGGSVRQGASSGSCARGRSTAQPGGTRPRLACPTSPRDSTW